MNLIPFLAQQLGGGATAGIWHIFIIILEIAAIAFLVWLVAWWALDKMVAAFWIVNLLLAAGGAHI
jgi:hypothetical protein